MNKELILEHYLSQLDRELQALPTGQRAEIITEIRSHILEASEKSPDKNIQSLIDDMGTPRDVAIRYLQQKGVKHWAPSKSRNWLRIIALSMAGMFAFVVLSTAFTVWYFSPLVHVDEQKGRVTLLGGLIDVNEQTDEVKIGSMHIKGNVKGNVRISDGKGVNININDGDEPDADMELSLNASTSEGEEDLAVKKVKTIKIPFNTAKMEIHPTSGTLFKWDCKNLGPTPPMTVTAGVLTFDLDKAKMAKCEFKMPAGMQTEIKGINGALELHKPNSAYDIKMTNAKIEIKPDKARTYDFEVKVANGSSDTFTRSTEKGALKVKVDVVNGVVSRN